MGSYTIDPTQMMEVLQSTPLDQSTIPQHRLDLANRSRTNLFPWRGQFSPQLVELLLREFSESGHVVVDPFVGVGTTCFEAARLGLTSMGADINPAAVAMADTVCFLPYTLRSRTKVFGQASAIMEEQLPASLPLFRSSGGAAEKVEDVLVGLVRHHHNQPLLKNIFQNTLVRFLASRDPLSVDMAFASMRQHQRLTSSLPITRVPCEIHHCDARNLPCQPCSVDLVLTSPPYVNVLNYHQNNRRSMELVGWDLLRVARSEFGSNRKNRGNRFLTVVQYCIDMHASMIELRRILRPSGRAVFIVGRESAVRGTRVLNGAIVAAIASGVGLELQLRQERRFTTRYGDSIFEDILHFVPGEQSRNSLSCPISIAKTALTQSLSHAIDRDVIADIEDATGRLDSVQPSPLFKPDEARMFDYG